ncbi:MAG: TonB-dependent receptor [Rhodanobacteraceae bacterium]|nr:TonB-dependent receptor [Rhodanobacteraceae bacterium]
MSVSLTVALLAALPLSNPEAEALDAVTVTASRRPQAAADVLAEVSVIDRAQIDASGAPDLLELLRRQPGVDLARTGGSGQQTSLFLRGGNSNHVLFLVDGVRVASANTGAAAFEHLPLDQIERIEIIRGPRATYFGSDAISGVIAITTRERSGPAGLLRVGSHGRTAAAAAYGAGDERGAFSVQLGGEEYAGFSASLPGAFGYDPDDDGYSHRNLGLRGRIELGTQRLGFSGLVTRQDVEFDQGETAVDQHAIAATLEGPLASGWMHRLTLGGARDDLDTPAYFARFLTRRENLDWVHDVAVGGAEHLVFGVNLQREHGSNVDTFAGPVAVFDESLAHHAAFVGWQGSRGAFEYEGALRYDDHETFGGETTAQAALGWRFDGGRVYANWGEGFRAPNLNELYSPGFGELFAGNPELDPERSRALELGLDLRFGERHRRHQRLSQRHRRPDRLPGRRDLPGDQCRTRPGRRRRAELRAADRRMDVRSQHHLAGRAQRRHRQRSVAAARAQGECRPRLRAQRIAAPGWGRGLCLRSPRFRWRAALVHAAGPARRLGLCRRVAPHRKTGQRLRPRVQPGQRICDGGTRVDSHVEVGAVSSGASSAQGAGPRSGACSSLLRFRRAPGAEQARLYAGHP